MQPDLAGVFRNSISWKGMQSICYHTMKIVYYMFGFMMMNVDISLDPANTCPMVVMQKIKQMKASACSLVLLYFCFIILMPLVNYFLSWDASSNFMMIYDGLIIFTWYPLEFYICVKFIQMIQRFNNVHSLFVRNQYKLVMFVQVISVLILSQEIFYRVCRLIINIIGLVNGNSYYYKTTPFLEFVADWVIVLAEILNQNCFTLLIFAIISQAK